MLTGARKRPYDSFIARHHRPDTFVRVVECYHRVALGASLEHEMGDILWEDLKWVRAKSRPSAASVICRFARQSVLWVPHSLKASATREVPTIFTFGRLLQLLASSLAGVPFCCSTPGRAGPD